MRSEAINKEEKRPNSILGFVATAAIFVLGVVTLQCFWGWYVASTFNIRLLTFRQAFGLWLVIRPIVPTEATPSKLTWDEIALGGVSKFVLLWLMAGIVHLL